MTNGKGNTASDYRIRSIGTGTARRPVLTGFDTGTSDQQATYKANKGNKLVLMGKKFGFLQDLPKMAHSILADPPDAASFVAFSVLKPSLDNDPCIVRINPRISPAKNPNSNKYELPDAWEKGEDAFVKLMDMDMDAVKPEDIDLILELCDKFIVSSTNSLAMPNQLIRGDKNSKHIGYATYADAKRHW
jgi:hypothetical protein